MPYSSEQKKNMPLQPIDHTLVSDLPIGGFDFSRSLYRCLICMAQGESNLHKYLDECHYFFEVK